MTLYKITIDVSPKGTQFLPTEVEVRETPTAYRGEGQRIDKNRLMKIENLFFEGTNRFHYSIYCLKENRLEAVRILIERVNSRYEQIQKDLKALEKPLAEMNEAAYPHISV